jgi:hypothetical protein
MEFMASLQKSYAEQVHDGLSWGGTWIPSTRVDVGDVGTFIDGVFVKVTDLSLLEISFSTEPSSYTADLSFSSQRGVSINTKAAGESSAAFQAVGAAKAGVAVSFQRGAGVVLSLSQLNGERVRDRPALEQELRRRLGSASWQEDYAVVVERLHAESATILMSREAGTKVEFEAAANVPGGAAALGSLAAGVNLAYADAMSQLLVAKSGLTPLFHTLRLKRGRWTGSVKAVFERASLDASSNPAEPERQLPDTDADAFETVDFDAES